MRFQSDAGLYQTAVAFEDKPAPDNPLPPRIFPEPITIVALWLLHQPNMTCSVADFQAA
jgi:hypothetical protein